MFYTKLVKSNFFEFSTDYAGGYLMLLGFIFDMLTLESQKKWGPRWFVPEKWRRNPNAYDYTRKVTSTMIRDEEENRNEEVICLICMNPIRYEVNENGAPIPIHQNN